MKLVSDILTTATQRKGEVSISKHENLGTLASFPRGAFFYKYKECNAKSTYELDNDTLKIVLNYSSNGNAYAFNGGKYGVCFDYVDWDLLKKALSVFNISISRTVDTYNGLDCYWEKLSFIIITYKNEKTLNLDFLQDAKKK